MVNEMSVGSSRNEMSLGDRLRLSIPPGGRWFWYQNDMLEIYQKQPGICLAWAKKMQGYAYGIYPDFTPYQIMRDVLHQNPADRRWAFELIPATATCKAYADIEWKGELDSAHDGIREIVANIRARCVERYQLNPLIHVACGSRPITDPPGFNNSYHIAIDNLHFEANHDGQMRALFTFDNETRIDLKVYSQNRVFRLPHCCKRTSDVPLLRISGDPLLDDFTQTFALDDIEAILPFFLVIQDLGHVPGVRVIPTVSPDPQQASSLLSTRPPPDQSEQGRRRRRLNPDPTPLPFPIQLIQDMLVSSGNTVSTPTRSVWLPDESKWQVQCDQGHQTRTCFIDPTRSHQDNNCLIFVERFKRRFKLRYHCTSPGCGGIAVLGYIAFSNEGEWQFALSSPGDPDPPDEPDEMLLDFDPKVPPEDPDNPLLNDYAAVKARFEARCFKIREPFSYGRIEKNHSLCLHSHTELRQYFCDWTHWIPHKNDDGTTKMVKEPFIDRWLRDPEKRVVHRVVVDPESTQPDEFNLWRGFFAESLPPVPDEDEPELIAPIIKHIDDVMTDGNKDHTGWILDYLANILQRPKQKTQVAISLYGLQGCGKGIIFEFFRLKVLGEHCSYQTSKPENDLLGRFANGAVNRVMIQVDEVKSLHEYADRLKDLITNPTINYEKKGKDTIVVSNLTNIILTSNNANSLTVTADDRRYVLFHCSSVYKGDPTYFNELGSHLDRPEVARAFFQYLLKRDLSPYPKSFQFSRPITEYYKDAQRNSIPVVSRFLSALANSSTITSLMARQFYQRYEAFHSGGNYKFLVTESSFGREMKRVPGLHLRRTQSGKAYVVDTKRIKQHLLEINEYDEEADFIF